MAANDIEKAWLFHEIGRCYLELGHNEKACDYGNKSLDAAKAINDEIWQLNATVLIAQSEAKIGDIDNMISAIEHFEASLEMTKKQSKYIFNFSIITLKFHLCFNKMMLLPKMLLLKH